jgi:hypothetical protein
MGMPYTATNYKLQIPSKENKFMERRICGRLLLKLNVELEAQ